MATIDDLDPILNANVTDDDYLVVFDKGAVSNPSKKITIAQLLQNVAKSGGSVSMTTITTTTFTATNAGVNNLTVNDKITFPSTFGISNLRFHEGSITVPAINSGAADTVDVAFSDITTNDYLTVTFAAALPDGLMVTPRVQAAGNVRLHLFNASGANISSGDYDVRIMAIQRYIPS